MNLSPEAILVLGKALGWIGIPLAWACWEVWKLRPSAQVADEESAEEPPGPTA
ncbi:MAG: hypothetical protein AAGH19_05675 [Pseudomonadota bacterium]